MRGRTEFPDFHDAAKDLRAQGHEVFNPPEKKEEVRTGLPDPTLGFLRVAFALDTAWICKEADMVALLPGWSLSKGACAEKALAEAIGLRVVYMFFDAGVWTF